MRPRVRSVLERTPCSLFCVCLALAGCAQPPRDIRTSEPPITGRAEQPDVASDARGNLFGAWAALDDEGAADIVFARFREAENAWAAPRRLNTTPRSAVAGRQVGPRLGLGAAGQVAVAWVDRGRDPAGDLVLATSKDGGVAFGEPRRANDDAEPLRAQEYHDLSVSPDGAVCLVWLDERDAPPDNANQKQVYFAESRDGGRSFSRNVPLTRAPGGVCPCCRPAIAAGDDGSLHVVYRDRVAERLVVRVASRAPGAEEFRLPVALSDGWRFPACPINGPAIAAGSGARVWVLWVEGAASDDPLWWTRGGDAEPEGSLFWTRSDDGGRTFAPAQEIASLAAGATDLQLAFPAPGGGALAAWRNDAGEVCTVTLPAEGAALTEAPAVAVAVAADGGFTRALAAAGSPRGVTLAWTDEGSAAPQALRVRSGAAAAAEETAIRPTSRFGRAPEAASSRGSPRSR